MMAKRQTQADAPREFKRVDNLHILPAMLKGFLRHALTSPRDLRYGFVKNCFTEFRLFSSRHVKTIDLSEITNIDAVHVSGRLTKRALGPVFDSFVLCALSRVVGCKKIFEIGTYLGETAWLIAHNSPDVRIYTLDLPSVDVAEHAKLQFTDRNYLEEHSRGTRFRDTPEESRIVQLYGDSATFDYSPYYGSMDLVFIDASHSYSYVRSDSENAFRMLTPEGTIVWDDYTYYPGIYAYLNEIAPTLHGPIMHIRGTRLAFYSRQQLVAA